MRHFSIEDAYANAIGVAIALTVFLIAKNIPAIKNNRLKAILLW